ncbi:PKD domain-containing protein [Flaviaesturariibacter terrae]
MSVRFSSIAFFLILLFPLLGNAQQRTAEPQVQIRAAGGKYLFVSRSTGQPVSAQRFDEARPFSGGFSVVRIGTQWGFVNGRGELVQPPAFDELSDFVEYATLARSGGSWKIIDTNRVVRRVFDANWQPPRRGGSSDPVRPPVTQVLTPHPDLPARTATTASGQCPFNLDFEAGNFSNWTCFAGTVQDDGFSTNVISVSQTPPLSGQHKIITRTPTSLLDYYGGFPINPPDGSQYAVKLGNDFVQRGAERIRYVVHVPSPANEYSIRFQYAVVLENPSGSGNEHEDWEQPRFTAKLSDSASGEFLPCASFNYVASLVPGFQLSPITTGGLHSSPTGSPIRYKPWSSVYVNLSRFAGRTLYFDFTTADCTLGGHFGYAYVDVSECGSAAKLTYNCTPPHETVLEGPPGFQSYQWWNQNFTQQLSTAPSFTINPGPVIGSGYWVIVKPFNNTDCNTCNCTDTLHVEANPVFPTANAGPDAVICETGTVSIGSAPANGVSYSWSPSTNLLSPNASSTVYNGTSSATYVLTAIDGNNCTATDTVSVSIQPKPRPGFTIANNALCAGDVFSFSNSSTVASGTLGYRWDFGDGSFSTDVNPTHTYATGGPYTVKLVVTTGAGCKDSSSLPITVYRKPTPAFTLNAQGQCLTNNLFQFTNGSSLNGGTFTGTWNFGDNSSSTDASPSHSYALPGTYPVTLVLTSDRGCIDSLRREMVVDPLPTAAFAVNSALQCLNGNSYQFTNNSTTPIGSLAYHWTFGDGNSASDAAPVHSYSNYGPFTVQLTVSTVNGCTHSVQLPVTVHPKPQPQFSINNGAQCLTGNRFVFSANATIGAGSINLTWDLGDNTSSTQNTITHTYASAGTFTVQLLAVSDKGCKDSLRLPAVVHPMPQPAFTLNSSAQCLNGNSFNAANGTTIGSGTMTYQWSYSDGAASTQTSPSHSFATYGPFSIGLVATSDKGCIDSTRQPVTVHPKPMPAFSINSAQQCLRGNSYQFNGAGSIAAGSISTTWYFGDGSTSTQVSPSHSYTIANLYNVRQVLTSDKGCKDSTSLPIDVVANPTVQTGVTPRSQKLCEGDSLQLSATGALIYSWSPATSLTCSNCASPQAFPRNDQAYYLVGFGRAGCPGEDTVLISVKHPIHVTAGGITVCSNVLGHLSAQGATTYSWSPATGLSDPASANPNVILDSTQLYQLVGFDSVNCFTDTVQVLVHVNPSPGVDLGPDLALPTGAVQQLQPVITNGPIVSWTWLPTQDLSCSNCPAPTVTVHHDLLYVLKVVNNFGCKSSDTLRIAAFCKDAQVFVANAFTPNGDGVNDVLYLQSSGIAKVRYFRIFNRWGELVFERTEFTPNDPRFSWDGRVRGVPASPDVFTWTAQVVCENKIEYNLKGNVSVLK